MAEETPPGRSPLSVGIGWAYRVTTLGLEFVVPALAGIWIDRRFGTSPVGVLLGAVLGFAVGLTHLVQLARKGNKPRS